MGAGAKDAPGKPTKTVNENEKEKGGSRPQGSTPRPPGEKGGGGKLEAGAEEVAVLLHLALHRQVNVLLANVRHKAAQQGGVHLACQGTKHSVGAKERRRRSILMRPPCS